MFQNIRDIEVNKMDSIYVLIKTINTIRGKGGAPYQQVMVRDTNGNEATFLQFDIMLDIQPPVIAKMKVECVEYGASIAFKIKNCEVTDECPMSAFLPKAHIDPKEGWSQFVKITRTIRSGLCRILCGIIADGRNRFLTLPLTPTGAFSRQSGLLEATLKLAALAEEAAKQQGLDRDLMVTGALLYYCGYLDTIDEGYNNTLVDVLYGPSVAACTKIQVKSMYLVESSEEAREEISGEDVMLLCHIMASKNKNTPPAIPEAAALIHLDRLVRDVDEMQDTLEKAESAITINRYNTNKRVYKRQSQPTGQQ